MIREFKEFAMRGNVLDMAIGIIIGAAFGKIVTSFVGDIIMPPIGKLMGNLDFSSLFINLSGTPYANLADAQAAGAPTINYGIFINTIIDFLIVAFVIFLIVKAVNKMKKKEIASEGPPDKKDCPFCFTAIPIKAFRCPACTSELQASK